MIDKVLRRAKRIVCVEKALNMCKNQKRLLDVDALIRLICEQFVCTERIAKEYYRIARSRIKMIDEDWAAYDRLFDGVE